MQGSNQQFMDRMNVVDHKIRAYARFFAFKAQFLEEDDLYQEAYLKLLERYHAEPDFLNSTDSYIYVYAAWMMKNLLNHENNMYVKHIVDIPETDKGDQQYSYPKGDYPPPESEAIRAEVHGIACQMPAVYRIIYDATVQGYEPEEIADLLGISKCRLNWRKSAMIDILNHAWSTPLKDREHVIRRMDKWPSVLNTPLDSVFLDDSWGFHNKSVHLIPSSIVE
jgi:RNA polymerase sigma factor (sigma-70 family)